MNVGSATSTGALAALLCALLAPSAQAEQERFPLPPREWPSPVMDRQIFAFFLLDQLDYRGQPGSDVFAWDAQAWIGGDYNKVWLKTEGETPTGGSTEEADVQALYARRISPFWFVQTGIRREARPRPASDSAVLAIQGLLPYRFNIEASAFLRGGELSGRLEAEYEVLFTQRLILQPRFETNFATSADPAREIGSGINDVQLGLRLRYEIRREFAPYLGVVWTRQIGDTADLAGARGEDTSEYAVVAGFRVWY